MQVTFISGEYPPKQGGVGDFTQALALTCAEAQSPHSTVSVITDSSAGSISHPPTIRVLPLCKNWGWQDLERIHRATLDSDVVNIQYQAAAYPGMKPPIHFLPDWLHWRLPKRRVVLTFHDLLVPYLFPKAGALRPLAVCHLARAADACIATNSGDAARLGMWGCRRVTEIPIGSNIPKAPPTGFTPAVWRVAQHLHPHRTVLGYFGFLHPSKGGGTLLRALAQLPPDTWQLLLIGGQTGSSDSQTTTPYAAELDALAQSLGIAQHIHRTGFLPPAQTSAALLSCDLLLQPYADGVSLRRGTLLACLTHGMPTISTEPAQPIAGLHSGENIWLVPVEDPTALAQAVLSLRDNPALCQHLGTAAAQFASNFSWAAIAQRTLQTFAAV